MTTEPAAVTFDRVHNHTEKKRQVLPLLGVHSHTEEISVIEETNHT